VKQHGPNQKQPMLNNHLSLQVPVLKLLDLQEVLPEVLVVLEQVVVVVCLRVLGLGMVWVTGLLILMKLLDRSFGITLPLVKHHGLNT